MENISVRKLNPLYSLTKYRNFRLLWSAGVLTQISEWVQNITLGWLALSLTNSAAFVGRVHFMTGLPLLLLSLPAGTLLDRVDRRKVLIICQIVGSLVAFAVAFAVSGGVLASWHLLLIAVLNGSLLAVSVPATQLSYRVSSSGMTSRTPSVLVPLAVARHELSDRHSVA